jgi:hypothetical protein
MSDPYADAATPRSFSPTPTPTPAQGNEPAEPVPGHPGPNPEEQHDDGRCHHIHFGGGRCAMPHLDGNLLCFYHFQRLNGPSGRRPVHPWRYSTIPLVSLAPVEDHTSVLHNLNQIAESFARQTISEKKAKIFSDIMRTALRTLHQQAQLEKRPDTVTAFAEQNGEFHVPSSSQPASPLPRGSFPPDPAPQFLHSSAHDYVSEVAPDPETCEKRRENDEIYLQMVSPIPTRVDVSHLRNASWQKVLRVHHRDNLIGGVPFGLILTPEEVVSLVPDIATVVPQYAPFLPAIPGNAAAPAAAAPLASPTANPPSQPAQNTAQDAVDDPRDTADLSHMGLWERQEEEIRRQLKREGLTLSAVAEDPALSPAAAHKPCISHTYRQYGRKPFVSHTYAKSRKIPQHAPKPPAKPQRGCPPPTAVPPAAGTLLSYREKP